MCVNVVEKPFKISWVQEHLYMPHCYADEKDKIAVQYGKVYNNRPWHIWLECIFSADIRVKLSNSTDFYSFEIFHLYLELWTTGRMLIKINCDFLISFQKHWCWLYTGLEVLETAKSIKCVICVVDCLHGMFYTLFLKFLFFPFKSSAPHSSPLGGSIAPTNHKVRRKSDDLAKAEYLSSIFIFFFAKAVGYV